ncbi:hypothetical protein [Muriicola jejuensis]|uniref:hypothetical protein n=1 Tax=Muriicola jejuensis TaxID=504488 RepID=UPI001953F282|nr:hypothetical protein [Muriicola jejuensis]
MKSKILAITLCSIICSCQTYFIPIESFRGQFSEIDSTSLIMVRTRGPAGDIAEYLANPIDQISCIDKSGNPVKVKNSPSIESRITTEDGKRTIFYFDRFVVQNDTLYGHRSRFLGMAKAIPLGNITKIEIQDGKKDFKYVKKK